MTHTLLKPLNFALLQKGTSELNHMETINHFSERFKRSDYFTKSEKEKDDTKKAIRQYANKNHRPI